MNRKNIEETPMCVDVPPLELWEDESWIEEFQIKLRKMQRKQKIREMALDAVAGLVFFVLMGGIAVVVML